MCERCDEESDSAEYRVLRDDVDTWGFTVLTYDDSPWAGSLACTVGLTETRDHPELLIAGCEIETAVDVLYSLGLVVAKRRRVDRRATVMYYGTRLGLADIDEEMLHSGLMNPWFWLYGCRADVSLTALQVVLPDGACCYEHQTTQPLYGRLRRRRVWKKVPDDDRLVVRLAR